MKNIYGVIEPSSNYQLSKEYPSLKENQLELYNNQFYEQQVNISKAKQTFTNTPGLNFGENTNLKLVLPQQYASKLGTQQAIETKLKKRIMIESSKKEQSTIKSTVIKIYDLLEEEEGNQIVIHSTNVEQNQGALIKQNQLFNQLEGKIQQQMSQQEGRNSFLSYSSNKGKIMGQIPKVDAESIHNQQSSVQPIQTNIQGGKNKQIFLKMKVQYSQLRKGIFFQGSQNQEYDHPQTGSLSKIPMDTGLQINSQASLQDEISSRHIMSQANYSGRYGSKKLLPALKSYQNINQQKIQVFELPKQKKIFDNFRNGKFAITSQQITNVYQFIKKPIPVGKVLQCKLIRNKQCGKMVYIDYDLMTADGKFLLGIKKMAFKCTSTYFISLMRQCYNEFDEYYLGKVVSNFSGSMFNLYCELPNSREKEIFSTICYSSSCFSSVTKAQQVDIYLKNHLCTYLELQGSQQQKDINLKNLFQIGKNKQAKKIRKLSNKQPKWNAEIDNYALNFHGKSKIGSVKNMIIIDGDRPNQQMLLLAKQDANQFAVDISYPFSPLVALGVLITSFDFKLISQ